MPKKITVIGQGTVGVMTVGLLLKRTGYNIEWIYDPSIPTTSVGEGTDLLMPLHLNQIFDFRGVDLLEVGGTVKHGIYKKNWGKGDPFFHSFNVQHTAIHFNALQLQAFLYQKLKNNPRLTIKEEYIEKPENLNSDHIIVCSGSPKNITDDQFIIKEHIPVNSAYIIQCDWERPEFNYTLTIARKYGWVFGIPLQKRCSIGYLFNNEVTPNIDDIKEDIKSVIEEYKLTPSNREPRLINFKSYIRRNNFGDKVSYNGNASFFLEPLEATSTGFSMDTAESIIKLINGEITKEEAQKNYEERMDNIETMIDLHYMAGSVFDTDFWKYAKPLAIKKIEKEFQRKSKIARFIHHSITSSIETDEGNQQFNGEEVSSFSYWPRYSYKFHALKLDTKDYFLNLNEKYLK
jgi:hypothetical protein